MRYPKLLCPIAFLLLSTSVFAQIGITAGMSLAKYSYAQSKPDESGAPAARTRTFSINMSWIFSKND